MPALGGLNPDGQGKDLNQEQKDRGSKSQVTKNGDPWGELAAFEVDGLLLDGISPEVQNSINALAKRIEPLHQELELVRGREIYYQELSNTHTFIEIMRRSEFLKKLSHIYLHAINLSQSPALVMIHILNADKIRCKAGRKALDKVLIEASCIIKECINEEAILGSLGGNDFGLIILDKNSNDLENLLKDISKHLLMKDLNFGAYNVKLEAVFGFKFLANITTAETALEEVDQNLLSKL